MDLDSAISKVNGMGRYQKKLLCISLIKDIYASFHMLGLVFLALTPDNIDCEKTEIVASSYYSIVNQWKLICSRGYYAEMAQSIYMCGVLVGAVIFGPLSDHYGRRKILFITYVGQIISSCLSAFAPSYNSFVLMRFVLGFCCQGVSLTSFTLVMEVVGAEHRAWVGIFVQISFSLGIPLLAGIAFFVSDWRRLSLVLGLLGLVILPFYRAVVESPRWLQVQGRVDEAEDTLRSIGRRNGLPEAELRAISLLPSSPAKAEAPPEADEPGENLLTVLRHPRLRLWTLLNLVCWSVNSGVYYGLTLLSGKMGSSRHLSVALSGLVELPSNLITPCLMRSIGRRATLNLFMYGAGACCVCIVALTRSTPLMVMALATLGKLCITGSFSTAYVYTSEMYPTSVRSASLGLVSMAARVGGIVAPFVLLVGGPGSHIPFIIFGLVAVVSATLNWKLPETNNKAMLQSVVDC